MNNILSYHMIINELKTIHITYYNYILYRVLYTYKDISTQIDIYNFVHHKNVTCTEKTINNLCKQKIKSANIIKRKKITFKKSI